MGKSKGRNLCYKNVLVLKRLFLVSPAKEIENWSSYYNEFAFPRNHRGRKEFHELRDDVVNRYGSESVF